MILWKWAIALLLMVIVVIPCGVYAQDEDSPRPLLWDVARAVLIDPTTYVPAAISYEAMMQDWKTSQALFARGWVEANPRFTVSGRPNDVPIGYAAGKGVIGRIAVNVLQQSAVHNVSAGLVERLLISRYPARKKLIRVASWMERIGYASLVSYRNSAKHFRQAALNRRLAREYHGR
jgi:hypothetical protein